MVRTTSTSFINGTRVEEVQTQHSIRAAARGRHRDDGEARGIRREDRVGLRDPIELRPEAVLDVEIFDHCLDEEVGVSEILQPRDITQVLQRLVPLRRRNLPALDSLGEGFLDRLTAFGAEIFRDLADSRGEAGGSRYLGDAASHQSATNHADPFDPFHPCSRRSSTCSSASCALDRTVRWVRATL